MEKIVGSIISKKTKKTYQVKWDSEEHSVWIKRELDWWYNVCNNVKNENDALTCAQEFIDFQSNTY